MRRHHRLLTAPALRRRPRLEGGGPGHGRPRSPGRENLPFPRRRSDSPLAILRKKDDGLAGADHYRATSDPQTFADLEGTFDLILSTVSAPLDFGAYLSLLKTDGTLVNVGIPEEPISLNLFSVIIGRKALAGSAIGGIAETQEMLDFCAEHGFGAEIELIRAEQINEAYKRLLEGDVRYRFVIDADTI